MNKESKNSFPVSFFLRKLQIAADASIASGDVEVWETENILTQHASNVISPKKKFFITPVMFPGCYHNLAKLP